MVWSYLNSAIWDCNQEKVKNWQKNSEKERRGKMPKKEEKGEKIKKFPFEPVTIEVIFLTA